MGCSSSSAIPAGEEDAFHSKYSLGQKLGEGTFGQVRSTKLRGRKNGQARNEPRAVKIIDVRGFGESADEAKLKDARHEAIVMEKVGEHENCVRLIEHFESKSLFYIVMEKCDGSLTEKLEEARVDEVDIVRLFWEMLRGIAHVHSVELVHRDIKPSNYLLFGGSKGALGTVKLADFGMATGPKNGKPALTGNCGSAPYMSPEMVSGKQYWQKTDVWSFGVTAYVLIYGDFPYMPKEMTSKAMKQKIKEGIPEPAFAPDPSSDVPIPSQSATDFLRTILQRSPDKRFTALEALQMPFITGRMGTSQSAVKVVQDKRLQYANTSVRSFRTAVQRTLMVESQLEEKRVDPTVAHKLDELLNMLQSTPHKAFTEGQKGLSGLVADRSRSREGHGDGTVKNRKYSKSRTLPVLASPSTPSLRLPSSDENLSRSESASATPSDPSSRGSHQRWAVGQEQHSSHEGLPCEVSAGRSTTRSQFNDEALTKALNAFIRGKSQDCSGRLSSGEEMVEHLKTGQGLMSLPTLLQPDSLKISTSRSKRKVVDGFCCGTTCGSLHALPESLQEREVFRRR